MGSPKGTGYIEKRRSGRKTQYRARRTSKGESLTGPWRLSYEQAQDDRKTLSPSKELEYSITLLDFIEWCITHRYPKKMAIETIATHQSVLRAHIQGSRIGRTPIQAITHDNFQDLIDGVDGSPHLVKKVGSVVSRAFIEAKRLRAVKVNPCDGAIYPSAKRRRTIVLSKEQLSLFADPSSLLESMMVVSIHTMLRRSEVCNLKWSEIVGETILLERDKTDDARAIPLSPQASQILRSQPQRSEFVFTRESGSPPDPDWYSKEWSKWRDEHKIDKRIRLHDLRGTGITILLADGYDIKTVQSIARHRDAKTTLNIYAQVVDANKKAAVSSLSKHTSKAHQSKEKKVKTG